jgi:epidermal growth factor receptor substrate 15
MPPTIEGYTLPILQQNTGGSVNRARSPPAPALPPLTAQDKAKFMKIFVSCNPVNGMLSGKSVSAFLIRPLI